MKLSIVIVNYNVKHYVSQCLDSVMRALEGIDGEVIVVDNHSRDDSVVHIKEHYPGVRLIESTHNLGFARANNMAIRASVGDYVLLLNPDTIVAENTLRDVLAFAESHERVGAIGVRMHNTDGTSAPESRRGVPTPMTAFYKMSGLQRWYPKSKRFGRYYMSYLGWDEAAQIEIVSGAFCFLSRAALEEIGLLDTAFFMYGEDIDLSYRLLKAGYTNWYVPADIIHYKGESTRKTSFVYIHTFYQAMLIFFRKHFGHMGWAFSLPIKCAIYASACIALVRMWSKAMRKALGFIEAMAAEPLFLFVGSKTMIDECAAIARRKGLSAEYITIDTAAAFDPSSIAKSTRGAMHIVFDTAVFSYRDMIDTMAADPQEDVRLATYDAKRKVIITQHEILEAL